jgi:hypothetical protein
MLPNVVNRLSQSPHVELRLLVSNVNFIRLNRKVRMCGAITSSVREWQRTLERERSFYDFWKQVNLVERTWHDDLRAMPELSGFCESFSRAEPTRSISKT